jgi:hypothetical protein
MQHDGAAAIEGILVGRARRRPALRGGHWRSQPCSGHSRMAPSGLAC